MSAYIDELSLAIYLHIEYHYVLKHACAYATQVVSCKSTNGLLVFPLLQPNSSDISTMATLKLTRRAYTLRKPKNAHSASA
eukprot:m.193655 g.193655  ORF g.193655 m.193655 type:complete len:81 (+) comp14881_c0_seq14:4400-4642(+)